MFEAFTDAARIVMALANREAQREDHDQIYAAHILLGIMKAETGVGGRTLHALGVTPANARREIEKLMKSGSGSLAEKLPPTSEAKKAIENAMAESRDLGHDSIGTGHMLLGLLGERDGVPAKVLQNLGLTISVVREEVVELLRKTNGADD